MNLKSVFSAAAVFMLIVSALYAEPSISGYAENNTGVFPGRDFEYSSVTNTFNLDFSQSSGRAGFTASPSVIQKHGESAEINMREIYLDVYFDNADLRIGRQQIIWGKADGAFITDVVSPKNLSEFLIPDFNEIRMGVNALRFSWYSGNSTLDMVWVPVFTPSVAPAADSPWHITQPVPAGWTPDDSGLAVENSFENSEFFARLSVLGSRADFEIMGGYMTDDTPAFSLDPDNTIYQLGYHRLGIAGGSITVPAGNFVFRGEGAYYFGKDFTPLFSSGESGTIEKDYIHYLAGADYFISGYNFGIQFIQQVIPDYDDAIARSRTETTMTFSAGKSFFRETLNLKVFSYFGLDNRDALIRPKAGYDFSDGVNAEIGADIFTGNKGNYGQYSGSNIVYAKIRYSF